MKLLPKLLLGIGCLLLIMILILSIFPVFFIRRDVQKTTEKIEELLERRHRQFIQSNEEWLEYELFHAEENIRSLLSTFYRNQSLLDELMFDPDNPLVNSWEILGEIAGYDPEIGIIQLHSPQEKKAAVILPHETYLYPILDHYQENGVSNLLLVHPRTGEVEEYGYTAIPLTEDKASSPKYYALIEPQLLKEKLTPSTEKLPKIAKKREWDITLEMIQTLIPLFVEGLPVDEEQDRKREVAGLARVNAKGEGVAILSKDAFRTAPLFNDKRHYDMNPPTQTRLPLSEEVLIIPRPEGNHIYLSNILLVDSNYLTLAFPIGILAKRLALTSKTGVLMHVNKEHWIGYNEKGENLSGNEINLMLTEGLLEETRLKSIVEGINYFLFPSGTFFNGNLVFFGVYSLEGRLTILNTLKNFEDSLAERISLQLALLSLIIMILILLFAIRFALSVIYPIKKLAEATHSVASGRYDEITLPHLGRRKDEVAILTRSFGEMIKGLQDREKIRGVLDKVVSKDVAREILKAQIHLGGEDRVVSILFGDIREFSQLTRDLSPQKTIEMLNLCMTKISHVIEGEGGVIDKYVGDEVMALFGAPTQCPDHALRAISTAMLIIETLKKWNEERKREGNPAVEMGIGVHTGLVVAGNMGAENRLNYTVLGSNVNIAARLCEAAKSYQLIISKNTLDEPNIEDSFHVRSLPDLTLKGFLEPIQIYEVIGFKWENSR